MIQESNSQFKKCHTNDYICDMISFDNTKIAFKSKSNRELAWARVMFSLIGAKQLVAGGKLILSASLKMGLPIGGVVKKTIYRQFCGGENIPACRVTAQKLVQYNIGSILNYSAEGKTTEKDFDFAVKEVLKTVKEAQENPNVSFCVFKMSGLGRVGLLEKASLNEALSKSEEDEFGRVKLRVDALCKSAYENGVKILIDAEESWIQTAIDEVATEMMRAYNKEQAIVYNTIQMYRKDRLAFLKNSVAQASETGFKVGVKLVRGAYMDKERERAHKMGYDSPIQETKKDTDNDFDAALRFCVENLGLVALCSGTHNEKSSYLLTELMQEYNVDKSDPLVYSSQLLGMSDQISFNLAAAGYNVAKFVPYGPVREVIPYLIRRLEENTSVAGQTGRELNLLVQETNRRKSGNK